MKRTFLIVAFSLSAACPFAQAAENLSQLLTDARVLALDPAGSRQRFTDAQITNWLNVAQRELVTQTHCMQNSQIITLTQGTTYYRLNADFSAIARVVIGNKYISQMSPYDLDGSSRSWATRTGYPTNYFLNFSTQSQIGFYPFPQVGTDTDTVTVDYYQQTTDMANSTDQPFNGNLLLADYQHALPYFAAAMMETIAGLDGQAKAYYGIYTGVIPLAQKRCMQIANILPIAEIRP